LHLKETFGQRPLGDITADDIEHYLRRRLQARVQVRTAGGVIQRDRLKPTTVHQELRVLRRMMDVAVRKKLLPANPCAGVEFPVKAKGLFRPHYVSWSEQQRIEFQGPAYLRNIIRIITESGLRVYKGLMPMKKEQVDLENAVVWIPDSKTPNGIAEVPLTDLALEAFREQIRISGPGTWLFPERRESDRSSEDTQDGLARHVATGQGAVFPGGVADEWVTRLLRQEMQKVFKKYSQMKLQMKRAALQKLNRKANEGLPGFDTKRPN
jgi:integrase